MSTQAETTTNNGNGSVTTVKWGATKWRPSMMKREIKKIVRTLLIYFPYLRESKFFFQRLIHNTLKIPFEKDFEAIRLFPKIEDALYLDIGGNRGFAIDAILMKNRNCKIYSFEPNPKLFKKTEARFKNNGRVEVYNWGLGDKEGEFILYMPVYRGYEFDGLASLKIEHAISWLKNNNLYFYKEKYLEIREYKCSIKKLDDLKLNPFFMKIDVQGYEFPVLLGGEETIKNFHPIILIESVNKRDGVLNFLEKFGYRLYKYDNNKFIPNESGRLNSFLMTDEKFKMLRPLSPTLTVASDMKWTTFLLLLMACNQIYGA
jgi:FkbM family methyltransferase